MRLIVSTGLHPPACSSQGGKAPLLAAAAGGQGQEDVRKHKISDFCTGQLVTSPCITLNMIDDLYSHGKINKLRTKPW